MRQERSSWNRRQFLVLSGGSAAAMLIAGCGRSREGSNLVLPGDASVQLRERERAVAGSTVRSYDLVAGVTDLDLAGRVVRTVGYSGKVPGPEIRARAGDEVEVRLRNELGGPTSIHWHGLAIRNDMDGVPDMTQPAVGAGTTFTYRFIVPDSGTYWFHPHMGLDLDRGMYAPFIVDARDESLRYDADATLMLDDWLDGIDGASPEGTFRTLTSGGMGGMGGMNHGAMGGSGSMMSDLGDVSYPFHLVNGRPPADAPTITVGDQARVRLRLVNAGSDTIYRVAVGGRTMTVTHLDGFPIEPIDVDAISLSMGERADVLVDAGVGVWPIVGVPEGKQGAARAWLRTRGAGSTTPTVGNRLAEHDRRLFDLAAARATEAVALPETAPARTVDVRLTGNMMNYRWGIDGKPFGKHRPIEVEAGQRLRLRLRNQTMMVHPMHLHGHTFAVAATRGARKDTILVPAMQSVSVDFVADNPGQWMLHCHNTYHLESGMATEVSYVSG